jgi:hypothetical protein
MCEVKAIIEWWRYENEEFAQGQGRSQENSKLRFFILLMPLYPWALLTM